MYEYFKLHASTNLHILGKKKFWKLQKISQITSEEKSRYRFLSNEMLIKRKTIQWDHQLHTVHEVATLILAKESSTLKMKLLGTC